MTVAAKRCNLTKSAVSRHIKALEEELGCELFDRNSSDFVLTEEGENFLKRAKNAVAELKTAKDEAVSSKGDMRGELRIGVGSFIAPYIRRSAIEYKKRYPGVLLKVTFGSAQILNRMLRNGELDLAFTMNEAYHYEGIESQPCIPFNLSCIMSRRNRFADKDVISYDDLMQCHIVMPDVGERVFQTFQRYTPLCDLSKLPVDIIISDASEALMALDELDYVTFLPPEYTITSHRLIAKPIKGLDIELMSNVHRLKDTPLKASARAFIETINELKGKTDRWTTGQY